jgi:hypothetical protein
MLCENSCIRLKVKTVNPATFFMVNLGSLELGYLDIMDEVFSSWPDLTGQPIGHPNIKYFTDGNSFVWDGTCFARYAVVTLNSVIKACLLPVKTSAQKDELVTLTWALQLTAGVQ